MTQTLLLCFDEKDIDPDQKEITYKSKIAGLSILKRVLLNFQFLAGKKVVFIIPDTLKTHLEKEIHDNRLTLPVEIYNPSEVKQIKDALSESFIFAGEKAVFEKNYLHKLIKQDTLTSIQKISYQNKTKKIDESNKKNESKYYLVPKDILSNYSKPDFSKSNFDNWITEQNPEPLDLGELFYIEIQSKNDIKQAEKGLLKFLTKPTDPFISRTFNRPVSLFFTSFLMHTSITPNAMTFVTFLTSLIALAFILLAKPGWEGYIYGIIGGFIFHMASVIDGCDGELARLKFQFSKTGELLDGLVDDIKNGLFAFAIGLRVYWNYIDTDPDIASYCYIALWVLAIAFGIAKILQYQKLIASGKLDILDYKYYFEEKVEANIPISLFSKFFAGIRNISRSDFLAFFYMWLIIFNLFEVAFVIFTLFSIGFCLFVIAQTVMNQKADSKPA